MIIAEDIDWNAEEPREKHTHCRRGHPYNERNTQPKTRQVNGVTYKVRTCRRCKALADARYRARRRYASGVENAVEARI